MSPCHFLTVSTRSGRRKRRSESTRMTWRVRRASTLIVYAKPRAGTSEDTNDRRFPASLHAARADQAGPGRQADRPFRRERRAELHRSYAALGSRRACRDDGCGRHRCCIPDQRGGHVGEPGGLETLQRQGEAGREGLPGPVHRLGPRPCARRAGAHPRAQPLRQRARHAGRRHHLGDGRQVPRRSGARAVLDRVREARPVRVRPSGAEAQLFAAVRRLRHRALGRPRVFAGDGDDPADQLRRVRPSSQAHRAHVASRRRVAGVLARVRGYQDKDFWGVKDNAGTAARPPRISTTTSTTTWCSTAPASAAPSAP